MEIRTPDRPARLGGGEMYLIHDAEGRFYLRILSTVVLNVHIP